MYYVPIDQVSQKRTIRPMYAQHQATSYAGYLDPNWNRAYDIYPGMVMALNGPEQFTLFTGASNQMPFGLGALFVAPKLGIDEVRYTGANLFTTWVGGDDATFEVLAPAFDPNANWTYPTTGQRVMLTATTSANTAGPGLLTPLATGSTGSGESNIGAYPIAELLSVTGTSKIYVRLNRYNGLSNN